MVSKTGTKTMASSSVNSTESDTLIKLRNFGKKLHNHLHSDDQLLEYLDKLELVLSIVEQNPPNSLKEALVPSMKAQVSGELLRHSNEDVRISVTACLTEVIRITAPDAPYDDEPMKEILKLIVEALEKLSHVSGRCYEKALTIVKNVSTYQMFLIMLDLYCEDLVVEMFRHFVRIIRSNHPSYVIDSMEKIMSMTLNECEEISLDLLRPLLECVQKENQTLSPISWRLGEKVITNCAVKLKPYLKQAVESSGRVLDGYAEIVTSICQNQFESSECNHSLGSSERRVQVVENNLGVTKDAVEEPRDDVIGAQCMDDTKMRSSSVSAKDSEVRKDSEVKPHVPIRKIAFTLKTGGKALVNPGFEVAKMESGFCEEKGKGQTEGKKRRSQNATPNKGLKNSCDMKGTFTKSASRTSSTTDENRKIILKRRHTTVPECQDHGNSLVGKRIKVWWPLDVTYYEGVVNSYDAVKGKHVILYDDGEMELLNLKRERWELIDANPDKEQGLGLQKLADASDMAEGTKKESKPKSLKGVKINPISRSDLADESTDDPLRNVDKQDSDGKPKTIRMKSDSYIKRNKAERS